MAKVKPQEEPSVCADEHKNYMNNSIKSIMKANKEDHLNDEERVYWKISSGSLTLDEYLGGGIKPSLIRLAGANNEGKTPQALEIIRNFLKDVPNSRAMWFLAEGRLSDENKERCGLKFTTKIDEWEDGTVFILETQIYELIIDTIRSAVLDNPDGKRVAFCIDSLDGLLLRADKDKGPEESHKVSGPQLLSKKMMQRLSIAMFKFGHLMIMISQVTASIQLDQYAKKVNRGGEFAGGNNLLHQADFILEYLPSTDNDYILDNPDGYIKDGKSKSLGKWAKVVMVKSTKETTRKKAIKYPIKFDRKPSGIWPEYEVADILLRFKHVEKPEKGSWITFNDSFKKEVVGLIDEIPDKIQGLNKLRSFLEENPKITEHFFKKTIDITT